jgi:hypothetical protein
MLLDLHVFVKHASSDTTALMHSKAEGLQLWCDATVDSERRLKRLPAEFRAYGPAISNVLLVSSASARQPELDHLV